MKKNCLSFLVIFYLSAHLVFSQQDSISPQAIRSFESKKSTDNNSRLPEQGDFGITFNFIGLLDTISIGTFKDFFGSDFIMGRYFIRDNSALRLGFGLNLNNEKRSTVDSIGSSLVSRDSSYKRTDFYFSPGFEKHFTRDKKLDPYLGSAFLIGKIGRTKIRDMVTSTDTTGTSTSEISIDQEGGYLIGINFIAGFNYFFSEKIAIGAEYGFGLLSSRYGGDWSEVRIDTPSSGSQSVNREIGSQSVNSTKFRMNSNAGIMLSYFF